MNRDTILPYALTTLQRVKDRIFDTNAGAQLNVTGTIASASTSITALSSVANMTVGQAIYGTGIPFGAYITAISGTTLTISAAATANTSGLAITVLNQPTAFDNVLIRMINSCTDWFEKACGGRRFAQTLYTNEVYSAIGPKQIYLFTKQAPICTYITSGNMVAGSAVITNIPSTAGMQAGMTILNCANIPQAQINTIVSVDSATQITISVPAGQTQSAVYFQINGLVAFDWRAGTPSAPSWIAFIPDQFELVQDGKAGIIRIYGTLPRLYDNMARVTYWAGFPINWQYAGDNTKHQLPADASDTVENLVVRRFKRRQLAGKTSEALEGATTAWNKEIDEDDKAVIGSYTLVAAVY